MRRAACWAAAIDILDVVFAGCAAEPALLNWARGHRFAGAKDRAFIRDLVFDVLRNYHLYSALGGGAGGRCLMIGRALSHAIALDDIFNGQGYAPDALSHAELSRIAPEDSALSEAVKYSIPDWLIPQLSRAERAQFRALRTRAPIDLRVNPRRADLQKVQQALRDFGVHAAPIAGLPYGLRITEQARGLQNLSAYQEGWFEFQDAGAQQVMGVLEGHRFRTALDYCAGGGGKTLALGAARPDVRLYAYDQNQSRMCDFSNRAKRADLDVTFLSKDPITQDGHYDLVIVDAPCSGSGAWRRNPDAKLRLNQARLHAFTEIQQNLLENSTRLTPKGGLVLYITCSIFECENQAQIARFLGQNPDFEIIHQQALPVGPSHDGFFMALLRQRL